MKSGNPGGRSRWTGSPLIRADGSPTPEGGAAAGAAFSRIYPALITFSYASEAMADGMD